MSMSEYEKTREAEEIVDTQIGFLIHFAVYVAVIALLVFLNWRSGDDWWAQWPAIGWGLGILLHAGLAFGRLPRAVSDWRLRRINRARHQL